MLGTLKKKFAPSMHQKKGIEYVAFFGALVLMLLTKIVPNSTIKGDHFEHQFSHLKKNIC